MVDSLAVLCYKYSTANKESDMICRRCNKDLPEDRFREKKRTCRKCFKSTPAQLYNRKFEDAAQNHKRRAGGGTIRGRDFRVLYEKNKLCFYCNSGVSLEFDHYIPLSAGGENSIDNVVMCCKSCNSRKGQQHPIDFLSEGAK